MRTEGRPYSRLLKDIRAKRARFPDAGKRTLNAPSLIISLVGPNVVPVPDKPPIDSIGDFTVR